MIKLGRIDYANVYPLFQQLKNVDGLKIVKGVPSFLNKAISEGVIDIAPCSCIEYAKNPDNYLLLPDISISCLNNVKSVMLFSSVKIEELGGRTIYLTGESATSVLLVEILIKKAYGLDVRFTSDESEADAWVFIGDKALFKYYHNDYSYGYDLGSEWKKFTGLPFVFALWIVRKELLDEKREELIQFAEKLGDIKKDSKRNLASLLDEYTFKGLTNYQILDYWETINYDLSDKHIEALLLYYEFAKKLGRIKDIPELKFI